MWCTVALLKNERFTTVACDRADVFLIARFRESGICGVFENRSSAEHFIAKLRRVLVDKDVARSPSGSDWKPPSIRAGSGC